MTYIEQIKQIILRLDAGTFQNLCTEYLSKNGYCNMVLLGGQAGTHKTTLGTPDAYCLTPDGKYVFVEYTTQVKGLFSKIKEDLAKCLDEEKTGIAHNKIAEIIYCHTSSNITPAQDNEIRLMCEKEGIRVIVIGIDRLAEDLYQNHHIIVRDYLNLSISTEQILPYDDFVKQYNSNIMAAKLDTKFLFREEEIKQIDEAFKKSNIVILCGVAGSGKTRLALHYAKNHSETFNEILYCIHNNDLPIDEDLKLFIDKPGDYFLFIDDANQLSLLHHIIHYITKQSDGYNVKILITVRDYAKQKVVNDVRSIALYKTIDIGNITDDEIKKLIESELGIIHPAYQERIVRISEGNARIAMLAGKVALDSNRLDSISDVSELYENYYGTFLENEKLIENNNMLTAAGIVAFLESIHLDHIDFLITLLNSKGLSEDAFRKEIHELHRKEIVDIYNDKAVRFSDQCLSNYMLKYVFVDKRIIPFSTMIEACFQYNKERTVTASNTLLNIFRNDEISEYVEAEIKGLWDKLSDMKSPYFFEFVKAFFPVNPTKALIILRDKIELEKTVVMAVSDIDTKTGKNHRSVNNDIIKILGGYADMYDLPTALDLFFEYYLKRPDLYMQFYQAATQHFIITKRSITRSFFTQIKFFEKIYEYSNNWSQDEIVLLFLETAREFLKLHFSSFENGRKNTSIFHQMPLVMSDGAREYRRIIWESLLDLCKIEKHKERIYELLNDYGGQIYEISCPVLEFDLPYMQTIVLTYFPSDKLRNCLLAKSIKEVFIRRKINCESLFYEYFEGEGFHLYSLLKGPDYTDEMKYEERKALKQKEIKSYVSDCDLSMFKALIDVCFDLNGLSSRRDWEIGEGLGIAFDEAIEKDYYVSAIEYYIIKDTPDNLHPHRLISPLFAVMPDKEVFDLINRHEFSSKNYWLYAYYHELPPTLITKEHLEGLYSFLSDDSDKYIVESPYRDVVFLDKFNVFDKDAFIKGCTIILKKVLYSPFIVKIYFGLFFNTSINTPEAVIGRFNGNLELLEKIYCAMLFHENGFDYNGQFLKTIYLIKPSILNVYIDYLTSKSTTFSGDDERNRCFWECDDYIEIYNEIFETLIRKAIFPTISVPHILKSILLPSKDRQEEWIRQCILRFSDDKTKMDCLFEATSDLTAEARAGYISLFLDHNSSFEDFKNIHLIPTFFSGFGSLVTIYTSWINFLKSLLPRLVGLKWIEHKQYIEDKIDYLKECINSKQIDEILHG